jgi:phosphohistidine phosphatase
MELYFLRHGEAEPASAGASDEARQLTERGRRETQAVAEAVHRAGLSPHAIFTSPLTRGRQTGEILRDMLGVSPQAEERLRPGCALGAVQEIISDHPGERLLLVGHEPDFSRVIGQLIGDARLQLKPSGLARLRADRVEPGQATLIWLLSPEVLGTR